MTTLAEIQRCFDRAMHDANALPAAHATACRGAIGRRFAIYRKSRIKKLVTVLRSSFPAVLTLVGEEYFEAAVREYVFRHPPTSPVLSTYGSRLGEFLGTLPAVRRYPFVADIARLEAACTMALHAMDAAPASISVLDTLHRDQVGRTRLTLHPSVSRLASRWPVVSIYLSTKEPGTKGDVDLSVGENALVARPAHDVCVYFLSPGTDQFLIALQQGNSLAGAARRARRKDATFNADNAIRCVFEAGIVTAANVR